MTDSALVFASIIVGLAVADQLVSFHRLMRERDKVRWDWATLAVALLVLLTIVQIWWGLAGGKAQTITIAAFLPVLVTLVILFLLASATLPDAVPEDGIDLHAYYDKNSSYIWTLFALALGWLLLVNNFAGATSFDALMQVAAQKMGDLVVLGIMISLVFVRKRWWHAIALLLLATGPISWLSRSLG